MQTMSYNVAVYWYSSVVSLSSVGSLQTRSLCVLCICILVSSLSVSSLSVSLSLQLVIQEKVLAPTEDLQVSEERPEEP